MKKFMILVEGQTEENFVKEVLYNYFIEKNILVNYSTIITSPGNRGGHVTYYKREKELKSFLSQSYDIVTTMFDYYKLGDDSPGWKTQPNTNCYDKVKHIEQAFKEQINHPKFIPYIQLHEFEALLFVNPNITAKNLIIGSDSLELKCEIDAIKQKFDTPEQINYDYSPSKRIISIFPAYNKVYYGSLITQDLGVNTIKQSCPHFEEWVKSLEGNLNL